MRRPALGLGEKRRGNNSPIARVISKARCPLFVELTLSMSTPNARYFAHCRHPLPFWSPPPHGASEDSRPSTGFGGKGSAPSFRLGERAEVRNASISPQLA